MKKLMLKKTNFIFLMFFVFLAACQENTDTMDILEKAQIEAETNPDEALALLSSIDNPENMDKDDYMRFIVTQVQAKYKSGQDIKNDTLIFKAKDYFNKINDPNEAAFANFYSGNVYFKRNEFSKALESYKEAIKYSLETNNSILAGRSSYNIGYTYFKQDLFDDAITYYEEALKYYEKISDTQSYQLQALHSIGIASLINKNLDAAFQYYEKGLNISKQTDNKRYQATFMHQLGLYYREVNKYKESEQYLHSALETTTSDNERLRLYLSFANLYNRMNQTDSAGYYIEKIKAEIPKVTDYYVLENIYEDISDYYEQIGNYKEALFYTDLQKMMVKRIAAENRAKELLDANSRYTILQKQKKLDEARQENFWYLAIIGITFFFIIAFAVKSIRVSRRKHKEEMAKIQMLKMGYYHKINNMRLLQNTYLEMMVGLFNVDMSARLLDEGKENTEHLIAQTKQMTEELKVKTNFQLMDWAKDYISNQPYADKIVSKLEEREILLLTLCAYEYTNEEISIIMELNNEEVNSEKSVLTDKLKDAGLTDPEIKEIKLS